MRSCNTSPWQTTAIPPCQRVLRIFYAPSPLVSLKSTPGYLSSMCLPLYSSLEIAPGDTSFIPEKPPFKLLPDQSLSSFLKGNPTLKRLNTSSSWSCARSKPSACSFVRNAFRPLCLPARARHTSQMLCNKPSNTCFLRCIMLAPVQSVFLRSLKAVL